MRRQAGARDEIPVDFRLIAATNRDLRRLTQEGLFRTDLYFRISVFPLVIPPLRARLDDLEIMIDALLENWSLALSGARPTVTPEALARLRSYYWPGNVRELENMLERALMLAPDGVTTPEHLLLGEPLPAAPAAPRRSAAAPPPVGLKAQVAEQERQALLAALERHSSVRKAARALGISHTTFLNKMKRLGVAHHK